MSLHRMSCTSGITNHSGSIATKCIVRTILNKLGVQLNIDADGSGYWSTCGRLTLDWTHILSKPQHDLQAEPLLQCSQLPLRHLAQVMGHASLGS